MTPKQFPPSSPVGGRISRLRALKAQQEAIQQKMEEEKAWLLGYALRHDLTTLSCGDTSVSRRERTQWRYSEHLAAATASLKARQAREQRNGTAVPTTTEHLVLNVSISAVLAASVEVAS